VSHCRKHCGGRP